MAPADAGDPEISPNPFQILSPDLHYDLFQSAVEFERTCVVISYRRLRIFAYLQALLKGVSSRHRHGNDGLAFLLAINEQCPDALEPPGLIKGEAQS